MVTRGHEPEAQERAGKRRSRTPALTYDAPVKQIPFPNRSRSPSATAASAAADSISLSGPSLRLRAALAEHDQLLAKIARRRADLDRLTETIRSTMTQVASRVAPLAAEGMRLDREVHAMFEALLGEKHSRRARKRLRGLHQDLQDAGVLSWREVDDASEGDDDPDSDVPFDPPYGSPFGPGGMPADLPHADSAPKQQDRGVLRDLYRRLVEAVHPDTVQDEGDKARRTEVMKDITRAFRDSDFARLVEIERSWAAALGRPDREDEVERRHAVLVENNLRLREQLRGLDRELRELRRSPEAQMVGDPKRRGRGGRPGSSGLEVMVDEVRVGVDTLRELHANVVAFRDGKVTLDRLIESNTPEYDQLDELDGLDEIFGDLPDINTAMGEFVKAMKKEVDARQGHPRRRAAAKQGPAGKRKPSR